MSGDTQPATAPAVGAEVALGACLFMIAQGNRPLAPPFGVRLGGLDEVQLGRGTSTAVTPRPADPRQVELRFADPRMSAAHARFVFVHRRWHVEDRGSRNGTFVNGARVERATLADGDLVDVGQAVLRYREAIRQDGDAVIRPRTTAVGLGSVVPEIQAQLDEVARMAASTLAILVEGETGTGKEVIARAIHAASGRAGAFVAVNCGALPRERIAAELFGWRRGAFPGAVADHLGLVRAADGGTLLLDEIGDLPLAEQAALLRALQEREVLPIAATRAVAVDLRVVAATHQPLDALAASGRFRADLLARLTGYRVALPALRDRREDLGLMIAEILRRRCPGEAASLTLQIAALRALVGWSWPANVRELDHAIARALVRRAPGRAIEAADLALPTAAPVEGAPIAHDAALRDELVALLRAHAGNVTAVARAMGKARMQVQRWLKRLALDPATFRR